MRLLSTLFKNKCTIEPLQTFHCTVAIHRHCLSTSIVVLQITSGLGLFITMGFFIFEINSHILGLCYSLLNV